MIDERFPNWDIDVEKGVVYSLIRKRNIGYLNSNGYYHTDKGYVHRIIWMVANQSDIPEGYDIHHIDGNTQNNSIYNLELIEHKTHVSKHSIGNQHSLGITPSAETRKKLSASQKKRQVAQYTLNGELLEIWSSVRDVIRSGFNNGVICKCLKGERKTHKGFIWKYYNEEKDVA